VFLDQQVIAFPRSSSGLHAVIPSTTKPLIWFLLSMPTKQNIIIKHYSMEAYMIMAAKPGNHPPKPAPSHSKELSAARD
jgi:hypothetical protein